MKSYKSLFLGLKKAGASITKFIGFEHLFFDVAGDFVAPDVGAFDAEITTEQFHECEIVTGLTFITEIQV